MEAIRKSPAGQAGQILFIRDRGKDKQFIVETIRNKVCRAEQLTFLELKRKYSEDVLFYIGLQHVTTTKKAFCEAMGIPVEAGCRYKRNLEKEGKLVQSDKEVVCPYTRHMAHLISTNPKEFARLRKMKSNQMKLF
ncbi:hypothetical protein [Parapedobacter soli]|uniref:hypothetical protein n=1 Tax=Parapedobacter soli TaxID=416955 RepID=UPI0021C98CB8|nr:hypothetical protein [Parapedobacter soli]